MTTSYRNGLLATAASLVLAGCATMNSERPMTAADTTTATTVTAADTSATAVAEAALIPREALFGNPVKSSGEISPDGKWLSWMAPWQDTLNIWVAPVDDPSAAKRITSITDRPPAGYIWAPDGKSVLYVQDKGGDENYLLYGVNLATGNETKLTPFDKTRVAGHRRIAIRSRTRC